MSLVVHNAYRFPVADTRKVHDHVRAQVRNSTRAKAGEVVTELTRRLDGVPSEEWEETVRGWMYPALPAGMGTTRWGYAIDDGKVEKFVREFMYQYHRWVEAFPGHSPSYDTVTTWGLTWDDIYGYLTLYPAAGVDPESLVEGYGGPLEEYWVDGRVMEAPDGHTYDEVRDVWEALLGDDGSIAAVGTTGSLSFYELNQVFRLA